jgi:hypothetical protein
MRKMNAKFSKLFATVLIAAMALAAVSIIMTPSAHAQSTPPAAPSFYIDPSSETFYTSSTPVGTEFNVTVMAAAVNGTDAWGIQVGFNASQLQAVNAGFTDVSKSMLFASLSGTTILGPIYDNVGATTGGNGSVEMSETALGSDFIPATTASVAYITFNVTAAPTSGNLTSLIDPGFGLPPTDETLFILQSPSTAFPSGEIDNATIGVGTYTYIYASATPPTISNVQQVPGVNSVNDSEQVFVTANITDNSGTGLYNATIMYTNDTVTWNSAAMSLNSTTELWGGTIPGYPMGTNVTYYIQSYDVSGNMANTTATEVLYTVIPEFPNVMLPIIVMMAVVLAIAVLITRKRRGR